MLYLGFPRSSAGKNLPVIQETWVRSLGWEDPLEAVMATHSNILAWRIPWTEEPGGCSLWGHKESDRTERLSPAHMLYLLFGTKFYQRVGKKNLQLFF